MDHANSPSRKPKENSVLVAMASTLVLFLVAALCWRVDSDWYRLLATSSDGVFERGEYWQLLTGQLVHADMSHLLSNALLFTFFAYLLYGYFGLRVFPVLCFFLGGLVNYLSLLTYRPAEIRLVGASGMVYLMVGFWLTMYMLIERRLSVGRRIVHAVGVGLIVLMPTVLHRQVSYRTHAIGVAVGLVSAVIYYWFSRREIQSAEVEAESLDEAAFDTVTGEPWLEADDI